MTETKPAVQQIAREQFAQLEEEATLEVGMQLVAQGQEGPMPFIISELSDEMVTADFQSCTCWTGPHVRTSKSSTSEKQPDDEQAHGHAHGPDGHHHH